MSIQSLALNQLISGLAVATSQFQLGRPASDVLTGFHPFLPTDELENGLATVVEPIRRLVANDIESSSETFVGAFYEAARQLAQITQESHPNISLWADDIRQVWRRGLSHPPAAESSAAVALDFRNDDAQIVEWLRQFIEFSPQPMGVVKCQADGSAEMMLFNRKNRERWGLSERDVAGVSVLRFFYPEDHDMVRAFIRECLETGSSTRTGVRMLRRSGGHLLVDMHVGRVDATGYAYFQVIDETQREEAFEEVRVRDAVFRNAGMPLLMLSFDDGGMPVGMVTSAGFDRMMGYEPGEIGTKPVMDFIPRHLRFIFAERLREFLKTGSLSWRAVELVCKDGSTVLVDIEANDSGVKDKRFAIVSFSDAKARIEAEHAALDAQKLGIVQTTSAQIAHDFNNLLTTISGGLQLLQMKHPNDEFLGSMINGADMMAGMMNRFRRMTDTVQGAIDIHSILDPTMIRLITHKAKEVEIELDLAKSPWKVAGPNFAVWQFVYNVIKNAMEAMETSEVRRLSLTTDNVELLSEDSLRRLDPENRFPNARPGGFVQLILQDTGNGIPPENLKKIFDDYFSTKNGTEAGRGRGLNATQRAISERGGLLTVRSQVGSGTTFEIYLPRAAEETAGSEGTAEGSSQTSAAATSMLDTRWISPGNEVVLVADDDETIRQQYGKILKYYGYKEVLFAENATETLRIAQERPDITALVMDWRMPGDTGDMLLSDLRTLRPELPILVNTGLIPAHKSMYVGVQFAVKLRGASNVGRALRRVIAGEPFDS